MVSSKKKSSKMSGMREILTFILAGGRGQRLDPLTRDRAKPAVPFGGNYRIIDFTLSNCVNSGLRRIYVLTQYKSFSLQKHLLAGWDIVSSQLGEFIDVIPAQQRVSWDWYRGTADAIYQNIYTIRDCDPKYVLILAGDHIYKMKYFEMIRKHKEKKADVTVACVRMPKETAVNFGVIEANAHDRIEGFQEKPEKPKSVPNHPNEIYASMGIYLFNCDVLLKELEEDAKAASDHDFGKNIIPQMIRHKRKVFAYNFVDENNNPLYWRDIGTRDAYYQSNMDLLEEHKGVDLDDRDWPVRSYNEQYPPVKFIMSESGAGEIINSMLSGGCLIHGARIEKSILSSNVIVNDQAQVKNSIIMDGVVIGRKANVKNAIIDKEVVVPDNASIGYDFELDRKRYVLTTQGIVIVPKRTSIPS